MRSTGLSLRLPALPETALLREWRQPLLGLLVGAAVAELLLLRLVLRMGPMLKGQDRFGGVFRGVQELGLAALNLATLVGVLALLLLASSMLRQPRGAARVAGGAALALAVALVATLLGGGSVAGPWLALLSPASMVAFWRALPGVGLRRLLPTMLLVAYLVMDLAYLGQTSTVVRWALPRAGWLFFLGEGLAVVAALSAVLAERPGWQPRAALGALVAMGLFTGLAVFQRPIAAAMTMWNFSFSLFLPLPLYALALGSYSYTVLALWLQGGLARLRAQALLLVALGGLKLDYSYYRLLALVGFLAFTQAFEEEHPSRRVRDLSPADSELLG